MKKFLSIILSALLLASVLAVSIFAGSEEPVTIAGTNGVIDFETEGQTDEKYYKRTLDGTNNYAKLSDWANDWRNGKIFKPAGNLATSKFAEGAKWEWSFDLYADPSKETARINFYLGNLQFQFNDDDDADAYYNSGRSTYALNNYKLKNGWNHVVVNVEMIEGGKAKVDMKLNDVVLEWNDGSVLVVENFLTGTRGVYDGLEMQMNSVVGTVGLDNIKLTAVKGDKKDDGKDNSDTADMFTCVMAVAVVSTIGVAVAKKKHK